jgi:hypothetical protein
VNRIAVLIAVLGLFVLATVSTISGVPAPDAAVRALMGAIILYVVARVSGQIVARVIAHAMLVRSPAGEWPDEEGPDVTVTEEPTEETSQ